MNKLVQNKVRVFAAFLMLLMAVNVFGGQALNGMPMGVTAAHADMDDLWNIVDYDENGNISIGDNIEDAGEVNFGTVTSKGRSILSWLTGLAALVLGGSLVWSIVVLSTSSGNATKRSQALAGIGWRIFAFALFGGIFVVIRFAWGLFSNM